MKKACLLSELVSAYPITEYHIKFSDEQILRSLWNLEDKSKIKICPFGIKEELYNLENIMGEKTIGQAKMIDALYYEKNLRTSYPLEGCQNYTACAFKDKTIGNKNISNQCVACEIYQTQGWDRLDSFTRYSNIAAANHIPEKIYLLLEGDADMNEEGLAETIGAAFDQKSYEEKEKLNRIEHIRWCRYHFMNNWDYDFNHETKRKDPVKRLHIDLIRYDELRKNKAEEADKDSDPYVALRYILK